MNTSTPAWRKRTLKNRINSELALIKSVSLVFEFSGATQENGSRSTSTIPRGVTRKLKLKKMASGSKRSRSEMIEAEELGTRLECSICNQDLGLESKLKLSAAVSMQFTNKIKLGSPKCGHLFHEVCLRQWLYECRQKKWPLTCPVCRKELKSDFVLSIFPPTANDAPVKKCGKCEQLGDQIKVLTNKVQQLEEKLAAIKEIASHDGKADEEENGNVSSEGEGSGQDDENGNADDEDSRNGGAEDNEGVNFNDGTDESVNGNETDAEVEEHDSDQGDEHLNGDDTDAELEDPGSYDCADEPVNGNESDAEMEERDSDESVNEPVNGNETDVEMEEHDSDEGENDDANSEDAEPDRYDSDEDDHDNENTNEIEADSDAHESDAMEDSDIGSKGSDSDAMENSEKSSDENDQDKQGDDSSGRNSDSERYPDSVADDLESDGDIDSD